MPHGGLPGAMLRFLAAVLLLALPVLAAGAMTAGSPALPPGGAIPARYACLGANVSPPLIVEGGPSGAASVALIMADPDAPLSPLAPLGLINFTHWLVWNVPLQDGRAAFAEATLPPGATQSAAYSGPCPPVPLDPHRYFFAFYALDTTLALGEGATRAQLEQAMQGHVLAEASFHGVFTRPLPLP